MDEDDDDDDLCYNLHEFTVEFETLKKGHTVKWLRATRIKYVEWFLFCDCTLKMLLLFLVSIFRFLFILILFFCSSCGALLQICIVIEMNATWIWNVVLHSDLPENRFHHIAIESYIKDLCYNWMQNAVELLVSTFGSSIVSTWCCCCCYSHLFRFFSSPLLWISLFRYLSFIQYIFRILLSFQLEKQSHAHA